MCLISSYSDTFTHDVLRDVYIALPMVTAYHVLCSTLGMPVACPNVDRGFDDLTRTLVDDRIAAFRIAVHQMCVLPTITVDTFLHVCRSIEPVLRVQLGATSNSFSG